MAAFGSSLRRVCVFEPYSIAGCQRVLRASAIMVTGDLRIFRRCRSCSRRGSGSRTVEAAFGRLRSGVVGRVASVGVQEGRPYAPGYRSAVMPARRRWDDHVHNASRAYCRTGTTPDRAGAGRDLVCRPMTEKVLPALPGSIPPAAPPPDTTATMPQPDTVLSPDRRYHDLHRSTARPRDGSAGPRFW
jgi:hypothetical protein